MKSTYSYSRGATRGNKVKSLNLDDEIDGAYGQTQNRKGKSQHQHLDVSQSLTLSDVSDVSDSQHYYQRSPTYGSPTYYHASPVARTG